MRATTRFEADVMRMRSAIVGLALAAILAGIAAFVIGLRTPTGAAVHAAPRYSQTG